MNKIYIELNIVDKNLSNVQNNEKVHWEVFYV